MQQTCIHAHTFIHRANNFQPLTKKHRLVSSGFPDGSDPGLIPGLGRSPGGGGGYPIQCSGLENSMAWRIPEEPGGLQPMWSERFGHNGAIYIYIFFFTLLIQQTHRHTHLHTFSFIEPIIFNRSTKIYQQIKV